MKIIAWFKDIKKEDVPTVGGKGASLGEMYNAKLPIPPGFFVTAQAFGKFMQVTELNREIFPLLDKINVNDTKQIQETSKKIQEMILDEEVPEDIANEIKVAYENMNIDVDVVNLSKQALDMIKAGRDIPWVAVRSSATAEDLPEASFAGQQATYLNIKGKENVVRAVQRCWASLYTARAIYYREKNNFPHDQVLISVVIQKMIDSDTSGVMFSINPTTNDHSEVTIEAGYGLGEAIVGGQITPDYYIVDKNNLKIKKKKINKQTWAYMRDEHLRRTIKKVVSEEDSQLQKLTDDQITKLSELARRIESHYGGKAQDIEFAIENNRIYIVQSRPVTTVKKVEISKSHEEIKLTPVIEGLGASPGIGKGKVKVIHSLDEASKMEKGDVLVTVMTNPDFVPYMEKASAIVTDEGGMTCHSAIVGREMGIPVVVGTMKGTKTFQDGELITVDGTSGKIYKGEAKIQEKEKDKKEYEFRETKTKIYMNLGVPDEIEEYKKLYFDGIGLMRLEFVIASEIKEHPLYLIKNNQQEKYVNGLYDNIKKVAKAIDPKPLVVRFSDFKSNEYKNLKGGEEFEPHEDNPMIGFRGISRYVSDEFKEAFKLECKAIKKLRKEFKNVHVMLPFVRNVEEVNKVLGIMKEAGLERDDSFEIYLMAEVPSFALLARDFANLDVSGCSIGSNDLTQLVLGVDRDSALLGKMGYFDEKNPAVKLAIKRIIRAFRDKGKKVSLCGQAGSDVEFASFLVREGVTGVSVNHDVVNEIRYNVANIEKENS